MMRSDFYFALKRRFSSAQFLPNYNQRASTIPNSTRVSRSRRAVCSATSLRNPFTVNRRAGGGAPTSARGVVKRFAGVREQTGGRGGFEIQPGWLREVGASLIRPQRQIP